MRKQFKLTDPKLAPARQVDAVKHDINKYLARERRKKITEGFDYWDFDCKFGSDATTAKEIPTTDINKSIDKLVAENLESFYIEILAKPARKLPKQKK